MSTLIYVSSAIILGLSALLIRSSLRSRGRKYPPGPPGDPIIGNVRQMAIEHPHVYYHELNKKYGELVYITAMGQEIVVLGSYEVANALLQKKAGIYSNRPPAPYVNTVLGLNGIMPTSQYNPHWKETRRLYAAHLSKSVCRDLYRSDIEEEAYKFALSAALASENTVDDYDKALHKTFLQTVYGTKFDSYDDPVVENAVHGTEIASAALIPARHSINRFPWLWYVPEWFPGTAWKQTGKKQNQTIHTMIRGGHQRVRKAEEEGTANHSFLLGMLQDKSSLSEELVLKNAGTALIAGGETTAAFVKWFIYAMLANPDVQKKAQEEIDRVIGPGRLPTVEDEQNLPYIQAVIKEVNRWRPVAPLSVPNLLIKDDIYKGYHIPKGATILTNVWAMSRDESIYPDPETFNPDRFMVPNPPMDPKLYVFGVGRRICPGIPYADNVYIATFLTIFATLNIVHARDKHGNEIPVDPRDPGTGRLVTAPLPFAFRLLPRSDAAVELLRDAVGN